jgi:LysM repeat protein
MKTSLNSKRYFPLCLLLPGRGWWRALASVSALLLAGGLLAQSETGDTGSRGVAGTNQAGAETVRTISREAEKKYRVQAGDTFYTIARRFSTTTTRLAAVNPEVDPRRLKIGQVLTIPPSEIVVPPNESDQLSAMDVTGYNQQIVTAASRGESWVKDPIRAVLHCVIPDTATPESWEFGERHVSMRYENSRLRVTIETTGLHDDSIAADKDVVLLSKEAGGHWRLDSLSSGWRCWPGRGHANYSREPCL